MPDSDSPSPQKRAPNTRVTMRTIAESLGVTKTTVSLARRDDPSISEPTTKRVKEQAAKLGYRPDPAIAAIASQRWSGVTTDRHRTIVFLCHNAPQTYNQSVYFPAAKQRATELGYKLERFFVDDYPSAKSISRVLYSRGIRGIIVPPLNNPNSKRALNVDWDKFTAVCCGIGRVRPPLHTVAPDTFAHTRLVWNVLEQAGHRRIGAALHCHQPVAHDDWLRIGASKAAVELMPFDETEQIPFNIEDVRDKDKLLDWYKTYRPEVVLGFNESVGEHLEEMGVRIPQETQFVSLNAPRGSKWSGIVHLFDEIASKSVDLLDSELRHNRWGLPSTPKITLVPPEWSEGETLNVVPKIVDDRLESVSPRRDPLPQEA